MDEGEREGRTRRKPRETRQDSVSAVRSPLNVAESSNPYAKPASKNPSRYIPDIAGFSALSRNEIKRDTKEMEMDRNSIHMLHTDYDSDEEIEKSVERTARPLCSDESTVYKKKLRNKAWQQNPHLIERELETLKRHLKTAQDEFDAIGDNEERWLESFEISRRSLVKDISKVKDDNKCLRRDSKLLYESCLHECEATAGRRRRGPMTMREIFEELSERNNQVETQLNNYEKLVSNMDSSSTAPILRIEVDELNYSYDKVSTGAVSNNEGVKVESSFGGASGVVGGNDSALDGNDKEDSKNSNSSNNNEKSSLFSDFFAVEEALSHCENTLSDLEFYFSNDLDDNDFESKMENSKGKGKKEKEASSKDNKDSKEGGKKEDSSWSVFPSRGQEDKMLSAVLKRPNERAWSQFLQDRITLSSAGRRKKRGPGHVLMSSFAVYRTPRDVRLFVSPLSQFEDRFIGEITGPNIYFDKENAQGPLPSSLPANIIAEEADVLLKCQLQSQVTRGETRIKRLKSAIADWRKIANDCRNSSNKSNNARLTAYSDNARDAAFLKNQLLANLGHSASSTDVDADLLEMKRESSSSSSMDTKLDKGAVSNAYSAPPPAPVPAAGGNVRGANLRRGANAGSFEQQQQQQQQQQPPPPQPVPSLKPQEVPVGRGGRAGGGGGGRKAVDDVVVYQDSEESEASAEPSAAITHSIKSSNNNNYNNSSNNSSKEVMPAKRKGRF